MTRAEAEAAVGRRVLVEGGKWNGWHGHIKGVTRKLVTVNLQSIGPCRIYGGIVNLSAYRLHLIEPKEEARG